MKDTIKQVRQGDNSSLLIEALSATPGRDLISSDKERISIIEYEKEIMRHIDGGARELIFNFSKIVFMNSAYIAMLIKFADCLQKQGGQMKLVEIDEKRVKLIEMMGVLRLFKIYATEEEAINDN